MKLFDAIKEVLRWGVIEEANQKNKTPIGLMYGDELVKLLMEHGIGVQKSTPDLFEFDKKFSNIFCGE